jgi:hypothetical protein
MYNQWLAVFSPDGESMPWAGVNEVVDKPNARSGGQPFLSRARNVTVFIPYNLAA